MPITQHELDRFHDFASRKVGGGAAWELDELLLLWYDEQDRGRINAIIEQGIQDIEAGRGRPAREVTEELRQRYGFPEP